MSGRERIAIFPSRANHVLMKQRVVAANKGLSLLKRKRDALEMKLRELTAQLRDSEGVITDVMSEAIFSLSKANFLGTDLKPAGVSCVERADVYMRSRSLKVVGVMLPTFELYSRPSDAIPLTGLSRGGIQVAVIRTKFQDALTNLIKYASLHYSVKVLKDAVNQNNMRVNGLDYVVIPRFVNTINYIRDELDEFEREDFYRLKRSQAKQRANKQRFTAMLKAKKEGALHEAEEEDEEGQ